MTGEDQQRKDEQSSMPKHLKDGLLVAGLLLAFGLGYLVARTAYSPSMQAANRRLMEMETNELRAKLEKVTESMTIDDRGEVYQEPNAEQIKILLDRYHASIGLSAKQYEQDTGTAITGRQSAVLVWLVKRTEHPCMMPLRFLRTHTDQIVNMSLSMDLELPDTTR